MTEQDHDEEQGGVRDRLGGVVHAVQDAVADVVAPAVDAVADRVAPAVDAVTSAFHDAGQVAAHIRGREAVSQEADSPDVEPVPSGTQIVRPPKGGTEFHAWRDGRWVPVRREHGVGWVWGA
jgi:hypothetical protein